MLALLHGLLSLTFPVDCLACGEIALSGAFCPVCGALVEPRPGPNCAICDGAVALGEGECLRCMAHPPPYERAWGVFDYVGPAGDAIRAGKYHGRPEALPAVAKALVAHLPSELRADPPHAVVAVPLHPKRAAEQRAPQVLAIAVAKALGRPCRTQTIVRVRETRAQAGLSERDRQRNVAGAFGPGPAIPPPDVLLVDDVLTTGATVRAATEALMRSGAVRVRVLAATLSERAL